MYPDTMKMYLYPYIRIEGQYVLPTVHETTVTVDRTIETLQ